MIEFRPIRLPGRWREGYALDVHTVSSVYLGEDEFGQPQFDTKRSPSGELLFRLKYQRDESALAPLIEAAVSCLAGWRPGIDLVAPVPPVVFHQH
jgi:hypothetical protein